jgi:hypothetical protein
MSARQCGSCSACCTVLGVVEIDKDEFTPCSHVAPGSEEGGCAVYGSRPASCEAYECLWLAGALPEDDDRPDKLGIVFSSNASPVLENYLQAAEVWPGAAGGDRAQALIKIIGEEHAVLRIEPGRRVLMCAPDEIYGRVIDVYMDQLVRKRANATGGEA